MKPSNLILSALMGIALASSAFAADAPLDSRDRAYRDYLEAHRQAEAAYRQHYLIGSTVALAIIIGLAAFVIMPVRRNMRRALEITERQTKILEEIKDLLKKQ